MATQQHRLSPSDREHLLSWENHNDDGKPLIGMDGGFTYISIIERLPKILQSMIESNKEEQLLQQHPEILHKLKALEEELVEGDVCTKLRISLKADQAVDDENVRADLENWAKYEKMFGVEDKNWLEMTWFFVENYFYRLILDITEFWKADSPLLRWDPFGNQKKKSLDVVFNSKSEKTVAQQFCELLSELPTEGDKILSLVRESIVLSLWGNQADLSLSTGLQNHTEKFKKSLEENILSNDLTEVVKILDNIKLKEKGTRHLAIILDNVGLELVSDMFMADTLLRLDFIDSVTFFGKYQPVFVSDVTERDFQQTISRFVDHEGIIGEYGKRFSQYIDNQQWKFKKHTFFTSPLEYTQIPQDLANELRNDFEFIFIKGDANYRRTINDAKLPIEQDFNQTLQYFPAKNGICSLRTIKSYSLIGIKDMEKFNSVKETVSNWRYSGDYGLVCLSSRK
ncbi:predicted protein [Naegleria gruberi]|uniref:Sugar phosphate phosphatase n=1 Tax=Naegleria gruberi TaxID=5762 RepID=D2V5J9_NAEGR|nr:uncharacterized protein NAEGRDRAFT_46849 [Naegleria gruberi]EFC47810.1 predicted protein [Naegleria gruberi]|eukprot:XP_002680554.1 predicted protein [Naegleria gruberi strain NEG-M]